MSNQAVIELTAVPTAGGGCCAPLAAAPLAPDQAGDLAKMFKALGDPVRLRLLSLITSAGGESCVCDLTAAFDLTGPTISHHLKVLREAGLVDSQRRGTWVYYWPRPDNLKQLSALLDTPGLTQ
jgi:ArsR family transcriptional regulator